VTGYDWDKAHEALESMDDYARMDKGVNPYGPYTVLRDLLTKAKAWEEAALRAQPSESQGREDAVAKPASDLARQQHQRYLNSQEGLLWRQTVALEKIAKDRTRPTAPAGNAGGGIPRKLDEAINCAVSNLEMIAAGHDTVTGDALSAEDARRIAKGAHDHLLTAWNSAATPQPDEPVAVDERELFKANHKHFDLTEDQDAWGRFKFKHSHIEAMFDGWKERAAIAAAPVAQSREVEAIMSRVVWDTGRGWLDCGSWDRLRALLAPSQEKAS
jgi:hypothetical protein